jgi:hypothetical protein
MMWDDDFDTRSSRGQQQSKPTLYGFRPRFFFSPIKAFSGSLESPGQGLSKTGLESVFDPQTNTGRL